MCDTMKQSPYQIPRKAKALHGYDVIIPKHGVECSFKKLRVKQKKQIYDYRGCWFKKSRQKLFVAVVLRLNTNVTQMIDWESNICIVSNSSFGLNLGTAPKNVCRYVISLQS